MELVKGEKYLCKWMTFGRLGQPTGEASGILEFTGEYNDITGDARMKDEVGGVYGYRLISQDDISELA